MFKLHWKCCWTDLRCEGNRFNYVLFVRVLFLYGGRSMFHKMRIVSGASWQTKLFCICFGCFWIIHFAVLCVFQPHFRYLHCVQTACRQHADSVQPVCRQLTCYFPLNERYAELEADVLHGSIAYELSKWVLCFVVSLVHMLASPL